LGGWRRAVSGHRRHGDGRAVRLPGPAGRADAAVLGVHGRDRDQRSGQCPAAGPAVWPADHRGTRGRLRAVGGALGVRDLADPLPCRRGVWRHLVRRVPLAYEPGLWSIVFPVGMYGVASRELGMALRVSWLTTLGRYEAWLALAVWAAVAIA